MKKNGSAIVIGVGHVGKKHALKLSKLFEKLYIIDPSESALNWCHKNLGSDTSLLNDFYDLNFERIHNVDNSVAIISNWGVDHYDTFFNLTKNKINKIKKKSYFTFTKNKQRHAE